MWCPACWWYPQTRWRYGSTSFQMSQRSWQNQIAHVLWSRYGLCCITSFFGMQDELLDTSRSVLVCRALFCAAIGFFWNKSMLKLGWGAFIDNLCIFLNLLLVRVEKIRIKKSSLVKFTAIDCWKRPRDSLCSFEPSQNTSSYPTIFVRPLWIPNRYTRAAEHPRKNMELAMIRASSCWKNDIPKETPAPIMARIKFVSDEADPAIFGNGCNAPATVFGLTKPSPKVKTPMGTITAVGVFNAVAAKANIKTAPTRPINTPQPIMRPRPCLVTSLPPINVPIR